NNSEISSSYTTILNATDSITNMGLIDGYITSLDAANSINNIGEGRIYGDYLSLQADTINNTKENDKSAVIAAREELNIGANIINNIDGSRLLSMGTLNIGGTLDENGFAIGKAKEINNLSASIESGSDMSLSSDEINNKSLIEAIKGTDTVSNDVITLNEKYYNGFIAGGYHANSVDVNSITSSLLDQYIQDGKTKQITISLKDSLDGYVLLNGKQYPITNNPNIRYVRSSGSDRIFIVPNDIEAFIDEVLIILNEKYSKFELETYYAIPTINNDNWFFMNMKPDSGYRLDMSLYQEEAKREYTSIINEEYFTNANQIKESFVLSGGNLKIKGNNVTNYLSTIQAAKNIDFDITGILSNKSESLYRHNSLTGRYYHVVGDDGGILGTGWFADDIYGWDPLPITKTSEQKIDELPSKILVGSTITGNFGSLQNGMEENVPFVHQVQEVSKNDTNGFSTATPNTSLPNSALFITSPDNPDYFIQTDPRFTNYQNFLSSDYMLDQLSLDPTTLHKRLGDGYYEQKLVREQIMQLTGKRFLDGFNSDEEQYMALLNSGVEFAKEYGISVGIALSAQQMQNLTKDVVLLVAKDITLSDGTKTTALVPQLYAAASKVNLSGSLISANSININVANTLSNSGTIYSDTTTNIQANALTNNQGYIKANNALAITTTNDLSNLSGSIEGSSINLKSTEGSIINKTLTNKMTAAHKVGDEHYVITGKKATIKSTGGNIILDAGKNIENSGADIKATNSISLKAGDKIIVDTVTDNRSYDFKLKNGYMKGEGTTNIASNISAGGDIMSQSGGDTKIIGANVKAGENIILKAGSSLDILAVVDSDYETSKFTSKGFLSKKSTTIESLKQNVVSTTINASNISLSGDSGIVLESAQLKANDTISLESTNGDILSTTKHYTNYTSTETKKSSLGSLLKSEAMKSLQNDSVSKTIIDASTVTIKSPNGDTILKGTDIQAQTVEAVASSLALISDKTNTTELSSSDKSGILTRTIIDSGDINEQAVATTINAKEIMLNGKSLLDEKLDRDKLFQTITSEYNLNSEQLIQVKAILNSKDWYDKTTTMSQMGQIIITAIATVATAGTGSAAVGAIGGISNATVNTAVIASVNALAANAMTQIASGVITGDMNLDFNAMIKSAALAGAFSVVTTTIDTQMGYNKIDPTTGKQIVLSYGDKVSQQVLHGLAQKAIYGGDIETIMANSLGNAAFEYVGHELYDNNPDFPIPKTVTHSLIGGTLSELAGGDFSQGAISTAVSHTISNALVGDYAMDVVVGDKSMDQTLIELEAISKVIAGAVVLATHENVSDKELESALAMASSVALYNDAKEIQKIKDSITPEEARYIQALRNEPGLVDISGIFIPLGKPIEAVLGGVASKLGVPVTALLEKLGVVSPRVVIVIEPKIIGQMASRGWTDESIKAVVSNPAKKVITQDIRFNPATGTRLNDPATGYIAKDGSYVVRNDRTGQIVQVSNKNKPNWKTPWDK
ncbi:MAG: colicin E5-related ribonuclease, partial [Sulfurovaceae bacterium]